MYFFPPSVIPPNSPFLIQRVHAIPYPLAWAFWLEIALNPKPDPHWETEMGAAGLFLRRAVANEWIKITFDSKAGFFELPKTRTKGWKQVREAVKAEAQLWKATYNLLVQVAMLSPTIDPAFVFYCLIEDFALLTPYLAYCDPIVGATHLVKEQQAINRKLQALENPFNPTERPATYQFIQQAIMFSEPAQMDMIRRHYYMPMVKARMALITLLRSHDPKRITLDGQVERRGRRKSGKKD
jgi:hypothetical protein